MLKNNDVSISIYRAEEVLMLNVLIAPCWREFFTFYKRVFSPFIYISISNIYKTKRFNEQNVIRIARIEGVLLLDLLGIPCRTELLTFCNRVCRPFILVNLSS